MRLICFRFRTQVSRLQDSRLGFHLAATAFPCAAAGCAGPADDGKPVASPELHPPAQKAASFIANVRNPKYPPGKKGKNAHLRDTRVANWTDRSRDLDGGASVATAVLGNVLWRLLWKGLR